MVTIYVSNGNTKKKLKSFSILYTTTSTHCMNMVNVQYNSSGQKWVINTSSISLTYNDTIYNASTNITSWGYASTKDITLYAYGT